MPETIPLFLPSQVILNKQAELLARLRSIETIIKNRVAPAGMVWDPTLESYRGWNTQEQQEWNAYLSGSGPVPSWASTSVLPAFVPQPPETYPVGGM